MKKYCAVFVLLLFAGISLKAQTGPALTALMGRSLYEITAEAGAEAAASGMAREMELRFGVYNRVFRFDPSALTTPLRVRVFSDKQGYDSYLRDRLGDTRPGALYLHYSQIERRELVVHLGSPETASMLAHQAFIQFLRAFIANPPSWIREGFAIYFSTLRVIPPDALDYEENLLWLEMAKAMGSRRRPPNAILLADLPNQPGFSSTEEFQVSSWALVSFLLNGGRDYFRTLTEIFMLLSPDASAAENSEAVARRFSLWNDFETTARDFGNYLSSRKTFKELMDDGQSAYSMGNFMSAELSFMAAMDQRPSDYAPYYYLGLLFYEGRDYAAAEQYYLASEERGADAALINYALGINAVSAGRYDDAAGYLRKAAALDPARYRTRVEDTLRRIGR